MAAQIAYLKAISSKSPFTQKIKGTIKGSALNTNKIENGPIMASYSILIVVQNTLWKYVMEFNLHEWSNMCGLSRNVKFSNIVVPLPST